MLPGNAAESLAPERLWTSEKGKQIRAELLRFEGPLGWYRTNDGVIHKLPDERFFSEDRRFLAKLRSEHVLKKSLSRVSGGSFYDSRLDDQVGYDKIWPYIKERGRQIQFAATLYRIDPGLLDHRSVTFRPDEGAPLTITYDASELTRNTSGPDWHRLSLGLERIPERIETLRAAVRSGGMTITLGEGRKAVTSRLTEEELAAVAEVLDLYDRIQPFGDDGTWFEATSSPEVSSAGISSPLSGAEQSPFRDAGLKPVIERRVWKMQGGGQLATAPVYGFVRNFVVLKSSKGDLIVQPFDAFDEEGRRTLVEARIAQQFDEDPEAVDGVSIYSWKRWADKPVQRTLLLARKRATGEPILYLDSYSYSFNAFDKLPGTVTVRYDSIPFLVKLAVPRGDAALLHESSRKMERPWLRYTFPISDEDSSDLLSLIQARDVYYIVSDGKSREDLKLREDQVEGLQEVLHCFRWLQEVDGK